MRHFTWTVVPLALVLCLSAPAYAEESQPCNDATVAAVARWAGIESAPIRQDEDNRLVVASACKPMPDAPDTTIAVAAFDTDHVGPSAERNLVQVVALIEGDKLVAANRSIIQEDAATHVGSFRIDTARYQLSPDVRAFGVVFYSDARGSRCFDASQDGELTLWIREGHALRPVFGTTLDGWVSIDGNSCGIERESARSEIMHMTIAVEKSSSHGLNDLSLTAHITKMRVSNNENVETGKRLVRKVFHYDGKSYGLDPFRNFWYPKTGIWAKLND